MHQLRQRNAATAVQRVRHQARCVGCHTDHSHGVFILLYVIAEQAEYTRENIEWKSIVFEDNKDCLELIEGRVPPGILALIDEQCMVKVRQRSSPISYAGELLKELSCRAYSCGSFALRESSWLHPISSLVERMCSKFLCRHSRILSWIPHTPKCMRQLRLTATVAVSFASVLITDVQGGPDDDKSKGKAAAGGKSDEPVVTAADQSLAGKLYKNLESHSTRFIVEKKDKVCARSLLHAGVCLMS